jgi:hypothetical protein
MRIMLAYIILITFNMICSSSLASIRDTVEVGIVTSLYDYGSNGNCCYVRTSRRPGTKSKFFMVHATRYIPINTQLSFYHMLYTGRILGAHSKGRIQNEDIWNRCHHVIKSWRTRWAGLVSKMHGEIRKAHRILVEKPQWKRPLKTS